MTSELIKSVKVSPKTHAVLEELKKMYGAHSQNEVIAYTLKLYLSMLIKNYCHTESDGILNHLCDLQDTLKPKMEIEN